MNRPFRPYEDRDRLLLNTFKEIESDLLRLLPPLPWIRLLVRGLLVALEDAYIDRQVQTTVDDAIRAYSLSELPPVKWTDQVTVEEVPLSVPGLPELRMRSTLIGP